MDILTAVLIIQRAYRNSLLRYYSGWLERSCGIPEDNLIYHYPITVLNTDTTNGSYVSDTSISGQGLAPKQPVLGPKCLAPNGEYYVKRGLTVRDGMKRKCIHDRCTRPSIQHPSEQYNDTFCAKYCKIHSNPDDALIRAAEDGDVQEVKRLLGTGADVLVANSFAFRLACGNGHVEIALILLQHGADLYALNNDALFMATQEGHDEVVKLLLESGADPAVLGDSVFSWDGERISRV